MSLNKRGILKVKVTCKKNNRKVDRGTGEVWVTCVHMCKDRELKEELCKLI